MLPLARALSQLKLNLCEEWNAKDGIRVRLKCAEYTQMLSIQIALRRTPQQSSCVKLDGICLLLQLHVVELPLDQSYPIDQVRQFPVYKLILLFEIKF